MQVCLCVCAVLSHGQALGPTPETLALTTTHIKYDKYIINKSDKRLENLTTKRAYILEATE